METELLSQISVLVPSRGFDWKQVHLRFYVLSHNCFSPLAGIRLETLPIRRRTLMKFEDINVFSPLAGIRLETVKH